MSAQQDLEKLLEIRRNNTKCNTCKHFTGEPNARKFTCQHHDQEVKKDPTLGVGFTGSRYCDGLACSYYEGA